MIIRSEMIIRLIDGNWFLVRLTTEEYQFLGTGVPLAKAMDEYMALRQIGGIYI